MSFSLAVVTMAQHTLLLLFDVSEPLDVSIKEIDTYLQQNISNNSVNLNLEVISVWDADSLGKALAV